MRILITPVLEAVEILKADNPGVELIATNDGLGIWMKGTSDLWENIVATDCDGTVRLFEKGDMTLAVTDDDFRRYVLEQKT